MHFIRPRDYEAIMPPYIPRHREIVAITGAAEIAGGVGTVIPATRRAAGWGLLALLAAVFPANVHMALHPELVRARGVPAWALWARLPLQPLMMLWVWRATLRRDRAEVAVRGVT